MAIIRWGILGTGAIAHKFASDMQYVGNGEIVAVGSRRRDTAAAFANTHGVSRSHGSYEALCADDEVDAIYVATPHSMHLPNGQAALEHGKAVLCEKPITTSSSEAQALIATAATRGRPLMEAMWTYFLPALQAARGWVEGGRIGRIRHIRADFGFSVAVDPASRLFDPALGGGAILDIGIYPIALAWYFLARDPVEIRVVGRRTSTGVDDDATMLFDFGEVTATLTTSFRCKLVNSAQIIGTEGIVLIPDFWQATEAELWVDGQTVERFKDPRAGFGLHYETESFGEDILAGRQQSSVVGWNTSLALQRLMERVRAEIP